MSILQIVRLGHPALVFFIDKVRRKETLAEYELWKKYWKEKKIV